MNRVIHLLRLTLLLFVFLALGQPLYAQDASTVTADQVNEVARELWCPLCSGVRLDGCELKACDQMKDEIAIKLAAGDDTESIKSYFVTQYGPQVLGEPPRSGFNLLAWILPVAVLLGGGLFVLTRGRSMMQDIRPAPVASSERPVPDDDYARRLDEELARHD
ncbi:MAG: cytochrome c-type biogenesis protein CcmH [Caldilineaceae bacterium]|nr:cytochrome c-type biogenesis protein CcmH [Caldilineaceae bacterium]MCB9140176.1 cytochrome c-type biogenesis protein CcmH [Caldilineaceae bacterium]